jgi:hypothetical protein
VAWSIVVTNFRSCFIRISLHPSPVQALGHFRVRPTLGTVRGAVQYSPLSEQGARFQGGLPYGLKNRLGLIGSAMA